MLFGPFSFFKDMSWHEKMECNRLKSRITKGDKVHVMLSDQVALLRKGGRTRRLGSRKYIICPRMVGSDSPKVSFGRYFLCSANQRLLSELQIIQCNSKYCVFNIKSSFEFTVFFLSFSLFFSIFNIYYFFIDSFILLKMIFTNDF